MTTPPEIPDSISASELAALLSGRRALPISRLIPSLSFGGATGGACDLQFAINQLVCASNGTNIVQVLCAAIHLITELDATLADQQQGLADGSEPFAQASTEERLTLERYLAQNRRGLQSSLLHLESVMAMLMPAFTYERVALLKRQGRLSPDLAHFRSQLLISDELLTDLELERDVVSAYINATAGDP